MKQRHSQGLWSASWNTTIRKPSCIPFWSLSWISCGRTWPPGTDNPGIAWNDLDAQDTARLVKFIAFNFPWRRSLLINTPVSWRMLTNSRIWWVTLRDHECCLLQQCFAMLCHALPRPNDPFSWTVSWPWSVSWSSCWPPAAWQPDETWDMCRGTKINFVREEPKMRRWRNILTQMAGNARRWSEGAAALSSATS